MNNICRMHCLAPYFCTRQTSPGGSQLVNDGRSGARSCGPRVRCADPGYTLAHSAVCAGGREGLAGLQPGFLDPARARTMRNILAVRHRA